MLKVVCWAGSVPFPPMSFPPVSLQRQVVLFADVACVHVFITGESLHCFLVGWCTNKSYVIATSDLWFFIHASYLLPSTPHPTPLQNLLCRGVGWGVEGKQNNGSVKPVSPRHCPATGALRNCCFNCCAGQSHKDNVRYTAVDEQLGQLEAKDVQLAQPSSTSLLMISSGQS